MCKTNFVHSHLDVSEVHSVLRSLGANLTVAEVDIALQRTGQKELTFEGLIRMLEDIRNNIDLIKKRTMLISIFQIFLT